MVREKFALTISVPEFILTFLDSMGGKSRSEKVKNIINNNIDSLQSQKTKSVSVSLDFETLEKIEKKSKELNVSFGRVIYLCLLREFCSRQTSNSPYTPERVQTPSPF
ncbi:MAG: hypothetical protein N2053_05165 [Chitinispirillaceae bacterium]|nr:hypothetical protein [Chitinispirillaceae bacterium]